MCQTKMPRSYPHSHHPIVATKRCVSGLKKSVGQKKYVLGLLFKHVQYLEMLLEVEGIDFVPFEM